MYLNLKQPVEFNRTGYRQATVVKVDEVHKRAQIAYVEKFGGNGTVEVNSETGVKIGEEETDNPLRLRNMSSEPPQEVFRIFFGREEWKKDQWRFLGGDEHQFMDGKSAQAKVKEYTTQAKEGGSAWRFMVRKDMENVSNTDWKAWMRRRVASGEYVPPPWKDEKWYAQFRDQHFAHLSREDNFQIAYVASDKDGLMDKITVCRPGNYLQQFFGNKLKQEELAKWVAAVDKECELHFARTPEEITEVYTTSGLSSCMAYATSHFKTPVHPTAIYGAGDLAIAYVRRKKKIIARALVWPEKKIIGRVYGDSERLLNRLVAEGYKSGEGKTSAFEGARLLRVPYREHVVCPYLDWSMTLDIDEEDDKFLRIKRGGRIGGGSTSGFTSMSAVTRMTCPRCSNTFQQANGHYVTDRQRAFCTSCAHTATYVCEVSGERYQIRGNQARVGIYRPGGSRIGWVSPSALNENPNSVQRIGRKAYYVRDLVLDKGEWVLPSNIEKKEAA